MLKPALLIIAGRIAGFSAAFLTPLILVRIFDLETFGTYKQWFLLYTTLLTITQIGMSESLLYFLPRAEAEAGRYVMNSMLFLGTVGAVAALILVMSSSTIAGWMSNPALGPLIPLLGLYLLFMQTSIGLETVMTARSSFRSAAIAYAVTDVSRALFLIVPILLVPSLRSLLYGAVVFSALRFAYTVRYFWQEFGSGFRPDAVCFARQLAYALPFAMYVVASVTQENFHQYAVSGLFDAATFAIYSIGCMQIPLVDLVATTVCNVMMVGMTNAIHDGRETHVLELWYDTVRKLALVFFPLACLLLITARDFIVMLFTDNYLASVPVFMVGVTAIFFAAFPVDGLLRVYAKMNLLLMVNLLRLAVIVLCIQWFVTSFGLVGAVFVTVLALAIGKLLGLIAMTGHWQIAVRNMLPWRTLSSIAALSIAAGLPALAVGYAIQTNPALRILLVGMVYASAYVGMAIGFGFLSLQERAVLSRPLEWLPFVRGIRYQHKIS
jgi:O-antigen/teichoic acid export membrane protein